MEGGVVNMEVKLWAKLKAANFKTKISDHASSNNITDNLFFLAC